jgi:hypothetical protein
VKVPKGTPLEISNVEGETEIGSIEGPLNLKISGRDGANVGSVGNTTIESTGSGDVDISKITGTFKTCIGGRGSIDISGGIVQNLCVDITGSGNFSFGGSAIGARLNVAGRGGIEVSSVNGTLSMEISGSGDIDVDGGSVSDLDIFISGRGDATFGGKAQDARLRITGSGDIDVDYVKNRPNQTITGRGDIEVGNW